MIAGGVANFDRMIFGPMLIAMAAHFHTTVGSASATGTWYVIAYGATQPIWAVFSDRIGRIRVVTWSLVAGTIASVVSMFAPSLTWLIIARVVAGSAFGAIVTMVITHIGDSVAVERRQSTLGDLLAWLAAGTASATLIAGVVTEFVDWRAAFAVSAIASAALFIAVTRTFHDHEHARIDIHPLQQVRAVVKSKWALLVLVLSFSEGFALLGVLAVLPAVAQDRGTSTTTAGAIVAVFGLAVIAGTRPVKRFAHRPLAPVGPGALALAVAHLAPLASDSPAALIVDVLLLGLAWAALHTSLQTWMTTVLVEARAMAIGFQTMTLFVGAGVGTWWAAHLLDAGRTTGMFGAAAVIGAFAGMAALVGRSRFTIPAQ